jgi:hypothetical protein
VKKTLPFAGLLSLVAFCANGAEVPDQTCEQIREQIKAQSGALPKANTELLKKLSARQECRFSAAEVIRAAYGDRPFPKQDAHAHRTHVDDDDDD